MPHTSSQRQKLSIKKTRYCAGLTTTAITAHGLLWNSRRKFNEPCFRIKKSDHGGIFTPQI
jgi:hypothetical protein